MNKFNTCNTVNQCTKLAKELVARLDPSKASTDARAALVLYACHERQEQIRAVKAQAKNAKLSSYEALVF